MTRRWTSRDVTDLSVKVAELVPEALSRAASDSDDGFPSGNGDGRGSTNDAGNPHSRSETLALSGDLSGDPVRQSLAALVKHLEGSYLAARDLCAVDPADRKLMFQQPGSGWCCNCSHYCAGKKNDRLKSGRCPKCYKHRQRHDGEEWRPAKDEQLEEAG